MAKPGPGILLVPIAVLATMLFQSCVFPNLKSIKNAEDVAGITIGKTSRDEVIAVLGKPNISEDSELLVYSWEKSRAFWFVAGGYSADGGPLGHKGFRAIVELDASGLVTEVSTASSTAQPRQMSEGWVRVRGCRTMVLPNALAISPDSEQLVTLTRNKLCFIPLSDPTSVRQIEMDKASRFAGVHGSCMAFSPDSRSLAVASGGRRLTLWDVATAQKVREFGDHEAPKTIKHLLPRPVAFSPDGSRLAAPDFGCALVMWEVDTGAEIFCHPRQVTVGTIAFSPDGSFLALGLRGGGFEVLDADTGQSLLLRDSTPDSPADTATAFSPDGNWLAVSTPVHVELWNLHVLRNSGWSSGREAVFLLPFFRQPPVLNVYRQPVIGFSEDGESLAVFAHEYISVVDTETLAVRDVYRFKYPGLSAAFDPAWRVLAVMSPAGLRLWTIPEDVRETH